MFQVFYATNNNAFYVIDTNNLLVSGWSFNCIGIPFHTPTPSLMHHINNNSTITHLQIVNPHSVIVDLGHYESIDDIINTNPHLLV